MERAFFVLFAAMMFLVLSACDGDNNSRHSIPSKSYGIVSGWDGLLVFTSTRGNTWTQIDVPTVLSQADFSGAAFSPKMPEKVWVISQRPNAIMTSTDTERNWKLYEGDLQSCLPSRIEAANMDAAWISCTTDGNQPFVLKTENGGETWVRQNAGPPLERNSISLQGLCVVNPQIAWMAAEYGPQNENHGMVWRTVDGGLTWDQKVTTQSSNDQLPPDLPYLSVAAISADEAWVVSGHNNTQGSSIYYTSDGGNTWTLQAKDLVTQFNDLNDIRIADGVLWIAGDSSTVFRSANGGGTWEEFSTPSAGYNLGIAALDGTTAWAVSSGQGFEEGSIVLTSDSGKTWGEQAYPAKSESQYLGNVAFESESYF